MIERVNHHGSFFIIYTNKSNKRQMYYVSSILEIAKRNAKGKKGKEKQGWMHVCKNKLRYDHQELKFGIDIAMEKILCQRNVTRRGL